jgi:hypothetical protein
VARVAAVKPPTTARAKGDLFTNGRHASQSSESQQIQDVAFDVPVDSLGREVMDVQRRVEVEFQNAVDRIRSGGGDVGDNHIEPANSGADRRRGLLGQAPLDRRHRIGEIQAVTSRADVGILAQENHRADGRDALGREALARQKGKLDGLEADALQRLSIAFSPVGILIFHRD